jgi:hypothetical protein
MTTETLKSIISIILLILYTLWCVLLYLIQGAFVILLHLYRYLVYVYQASCLLYLRWWLLPYLKNVQGRQFTALWGDTAFLPPDIRQRLEEVIDRCTKRTNATCHTVIQFLSRDISIRKLLHLMNCSCECRMERRSSRLNNPTSPELSKCGCCFRHDDQETLLYACGAVICIAFFIIVI